MARQGKFGRLVDDFVATVDELGGHIDPALVAADPQLRIDAMAMQFKVTRQTVLRTYIDDWGRDMAITVMADLRNRHDAELAGPDEHLAVRPAAKLLAALGQALLFAAVNDDRGSLNVRDAAEAVMALGMAVYNTPPGQEIVTVPAQIVARTRTALEVLRDRLSSGTWSTCPVGSNTARRTSVPPRCAPSARTCYFSQPGLYRPNVKPRCDASSKHSGPAKL